MEIQSVFVEFGRLLHERLSIKSLTTEDTIRYTLYYALTASRHLKHTDLTLEYPHPSLPKAKIDTVIRDVDGCGSMAFEFKYDRSNRSGSNQPRTQRAGGALKDLFRLAMVPANFAASKYFVYVTDAEMAGYFRRPGNRLDGLFDLADGDPYPVSAAMFAEHARTLAKMVEPLAHDCIVHQVYAEDLPANHCIRIFKVSAPFATTPSAPIVGCVTPVDFRNVALGTEHDHL